MNSTRGKGATQGVLRWPAYRWLLSAALVWLAMARAWAADSGTVMPRPPELERDVQFWIRVYSEVDTNGGFLHDQYNLGVVYQTLHFAPDAPPHERQRQVDDAREGLSAALRRIAEGGDAQLSPEDERIKELWGAEATPARLHAAMDDIRFQLGQSDRFRAGLIRSGAWETHIAETLANLGLPAELAVLPHVESSFNPSAYSKVGAAGLWQFAPFKHACLRLCRSPIGFLMGHWRAGSRGALRMGLAHGAYCLVCCWFLMALLFFGGVMNLWWIGGLAAYVLMEKVLPIGHWLGYVAGAGLIAWGAYLLVLA